MGQMLQTDALHLFYCASSDSWSVGMKNSPEFLLPAGFQESPLCFHFYVGFILLIL